MLLLQTLACCFQALGVVLETTVIGIFAKDDSLIPIVIEVEDFGESSLGLVELEQIRRDLALLVDLGSDEAELFADCKEIQLIEIFILTLYLSKTHPIFPLPLGKFDLGLHLRMQ